MLPLHSHRRYQILGELGRGAMGIVYRARDAQTGGEVALKTVSAVSPTFIHRLKQEFRALADVVHPNLVNLYELAFEEPHWFFTMELLGGTDFRSYVRGAATANTLTPIPTTLERSPALSEATDHSFSDPTETGTSTGDLEAPSISRALPDEITAILAGRAPKKSVAAILNPLMAVLSQLAAGVNGLHQHGLLHRDLKPSNVMVEPSGRVVLLDFGVITESAANDQTLAGTLPYMAPEILDGGSATAASDWYAVGVMLYEVLTGVRPIDFASAPTINGVRGMGMPPEVGEICADVPPELEAMCWGLLQREPRMRWDFPRIASVYELAGAPASGTLHLRSADVPLVGRDDELAHLSAAFHDALANGAQPVFVRGQVGLGKSSLVRQFLADVAQDGVTVLRGRCFEHETVPYKALDSLIDSMVNHLISVGAVQRAEILPSDAHRIARVFPAFNRLPEIANAETSSDPDDGGIEPQELRRRAFRSFRTLIDNIASTSRVVLFVDDIHWGDIDSLPLLQLLTEGLSTPRLMFLATYRIELETQSELLRAWIPEHGERNGSDPTFIDVGPLSEAAGARLVQELVPEHGWPPGMIQSLQSESQGNPYFLTELVDYMRERRGESKVSASLE